MKRWIYKFIPALLMLCLCLGGCGHSGRESGGEEAETKEAAAESNEEEEDGEEEEFQGEYPGTIAVRDVPETESPYYGIMYATVLDINGNMNDSSTVYSFKDKNDPDNAWSVTGLEVGDIEADLAPGTDVAILFHGDMVKDSENVEFLVILPDGEYQIKRTEGTTISNMMSSFTLQCQNGTELQFIKDNCKVDQGAMSRDSGDRVVVYYADGGEAGLFPLRVYKGD